MPKRVSANDFEKEVLSADKAVLPISIQTAVCLAKDFLLCFLSLMRSIQTGLK